MYDAFMPSHIEVYSREFHSARTHIDIQYEFIYWSAFVASSHFNRSRGSIFHLVVVCVSLLHKNNWIRQKWFVRRVRDNSFSRFSFSSQQTQMKTMIEPKMNDGLVELGLLEIMLENVHRWIFYLKTSIWPYRLSCVPVKVLFGQPEPPSMFRQLQYFIWIFIFAFFYIVSKLFWQVELNLWICEVKACSLCLIWNLHGGGNAPDANCNDIRLFFFFNLFALSHFANVGSKTNNIFVQCTHKNRKMSSPRDTSFNFRDASILTATKRKEKRKNRREKQTLWPPWVVGVEEWEAFFFSLV